MAFKDLDVGALAYKAGVTNGGRLAEAIAIAKLESGFDPNAEGDKGLQTEKWGPSIGLWQIRSLKADSGKGTDRDGSRLKDPTFNAKSMASISKNGNDWSAWSTWTRVQKQGLAAVYLPTAATILATKGNPPGLSGIAGGITGIGDAAQATGDALGNIRDIAVGAYNWTSDRNNWYRVAKVAIGAAMLVGGLYLVTRPVVGKQVDAVVGKVATVATKGKV